MRRQFTRIRCRMKRKGAGSTSAKASNPPLGGENSSEIQGLMRASKARWLKLAERNHRSLGRAPPCIELQYAAEAPT